MEAMDFLAPKSYKYTKTSFASINNFRGLTHRAPEAPLWKCTPCLCPVQTGTLLLHQHALGHTPDPEVHMSQGTQETAQHGLELLLRCIFNKGQLLRIQTSSLVTILGTQRG